MRERKRAGQRLSLSASDWNAAMEATDMLLGGKLNRRDNTLTAPRGNQDVLGKNTTGQTLPAFSVVGLSDTVTPTPQAKLIEWKQQNHQFDCVVPETPKHFGKWGITQEPLLANAVGRIRIAGIAVAHVSGTPPEDNWSEDPFPYFVECVDNQTTSLEIRYRGSAQVIWKEASSDWTIIRFGTAWRPHAIRATLVDGKAFEEETATDPHTAGSIIGIDDQWFGEEEIEVYNPLEIKLWEGCQVVAHWNATEEQWEVMAATSNKVVHGIRRKDCEFNKLDGAQGWHEWDEGSEAEWVISVDYDSCSLTYSTDCQANIPITDLDFVKSITYDSGTCELYYDTCSQQNQTAGQLIFVTAVYMSGNTLYFDRSCGGQVPILPFGECDETPPECGQCEFIAVDNEGVLEWQSTVACESSSCECDPPPVAPVVVGQAWTTHCRESQ